MEKLAKNNLQEYLQKRNLPLPTYSTFEINSEYSHVPLFKSILSLYDGKEYIGMSGDIYANIPGNKKEAEANAAILAYERLKGANQLPIPTKRLLFKQKVPSIYDLEFDEYDKILLVDGENCDIDPYHISSETLILAFVSKNTTKKRIFELQANNANYFVFISESTGKNSANYLLTFYAGQLSVLCKDKQYYVLTKGHYGEHLEKCMDKCKFVCSAEKIND